MTESVTFSLEKNLSVLILILTINKFNIDFYASYSRMFLKLLFLAAKVCIPNESI